MAVSAVVLAHMMYGKARCDSEKRDGKDVTCTTDERGDLIGILMNIANGLTIFFMCAICLVNLKPVKNAIKNCTGRFTFSDTCVNVNGMARDIIPKWDVDREVKHRVWHRFWDSFLAKKCGEEVAERVLELKENTFNFGFDRIEAHWKGAAIPEIRQARTICLQSLEGVDLYWPRDNKTTYDGGKQKTCFGKVWFDDYPFHGYVVYDNGEKPVALWTDEQIIMFVNLQYDPRVMQKKMLRTQLRALAKSKGKFYYPFQRRETERVADGTETYRDSKGNTKTRTHYSTVEFICSYNNGMLEVTSNNENVIMQPGFNIKVIYNDGTGSAIKPRTGQQVNFKERTAEMPSSHIGVDDATFDFNERNMAFFNLSANLWTPKVPEVLADFQKYRNELITARNKRTDTLGHGFWYVIYNREKQSMMQCLQYLNNSEKNEVLRTLGTKHKNGLQFLFKRMQFCNSHYGLAVWYVFWDDFWECNKDMKCLQDKELRPQFDPTSGKSLAYRPMDKEKLIEFLEAQRVNLWRKSGRAYFNDRMLDVLYKKIEDAQKRQADRFLNDKSLKPSLGDLEKQGRSTEKKYALRIDTQKARVSVMAPVLPSPTLSIIRQNTVAAAPMAVGSVPSTGSNLSAPRTSVVMMTSPRGGAMIQQGQQQFVMIPQQGQQGQQFLQGSPMTQHNSVIMMPNGQMMQNPQMMQNQQMMMQNQQMMMMQNQQGQQMMMQPQNQQGQQISTYTAGQLTNRNFVLPSG